MDDTRIDDRNIVLTGFMGTGKTTVGRLLAERLNFGFLDTDVVIEQRHGTIAEIFSQRGEDAFRSIEQGLAAELSERSRLVISTGGRMLLDPQNVARLSRNGRVFCLVATPDEIFDRVTSNPASIERPLLNVADPRQRIVELLAERGPLYRQFAQLATDRRSPASIATDLAALVQSAPKRFRISTPSDEQDYWLGAAILPLVRQLADVDGPIVVVTNEQVGRLYVASCGEVDLTITLPTGHRHTGQEDVQRVRDAIQTANIDRSATIVSLGNTTVGSVAEFVAAASPHVLDVVHCPTDLISMIDSTIGGEVGLELPPRKGLIEANKRTRAVIADVATLQSQSRAELAVGIAEFVKRGLIAGPELLDDLDADPSSPEPHDFRRTIEQLQSLVAQAIQLKVAISEETEEV